MYFCDSQTGKIRKIQTNLVDQGSLPVLLNFSEDGKTLWTWRRGDRLRACDEEGKEQLPGEGHEQPIRSLQLSPESRELISKDAASGCRCWDVATLQPTLPRASILNGS